MSYSQVFTDETLYLLCITHGTVDNAEAFVEWAVGVIGKARETGHTRILMDNRTFELHLSPLDVVTFASRLEAMNANSLGLRLAVVSSPANPEISRLVETSLINRSASYKSFRNQQEALDWLLPNTKQ